MIIKPGNLPWSVRDTLETSVHGDDTGPTTRRHAGALAHLAGLTAEAQVARHYVDQGANIVAQRWRGTSGEIDLIARDDTTLIFVEVKKSRTFAQAQSHLSPRQIARILQTGAEYAEQQGGGLVDMRFDVAVVNGVGQIEVIENAFL